MKKITLTSILILTSVFAYSQAPNFLWANRAGGPSSEVGSAVTFDLSGNTIATGYFESPTLVFGATTLTNTSSANLADIYIVKYDAAGNVLWAKSAEGLSAEASQSITTDTAGNIFVTGSFFSTITFDTISLTTSGNRDIFIAKYDAAGNVLWAKRAGGSAADYSWSIDADISGNVLLTGRFVGQTITFGTTTLTNADNSGSTEDAFVVKYDAQGNLLWAERIGGNSSDEGQSITTDTSGNVIVTGYYTSPEIIFGTDTFHNMGFYDVFIAKYNSSGGLLWAKSEGGNSTEQSRSITTDVSGNVVLTGFFQTDTLHWGSFDLVNIGAHNIFIAKYDAAGNLIWAKREGGTNYNIGQSISADSSGNIFLAGYFTCPSINFGSTTVFNADNSALTSDFFVVKYDMSGNALWAKSGGGDDDDYLVCGTVNSSGRVVITGFFQSPTIYFGTITLTNASSPGYWDMFVAKLDDFITGNEENINLPGELRVFPNPGTGKFTLSKQGEVFIYDALGRLIVTQIISSPDSQIDLSLQPKGLYFVQLRSEEAILNGKIILE